ncbi:MAG: hypothetical protein HYZ28_25760 [Myxococcales bacterium]|nr:hypothetical protein [Myxococcales bacterium]
MDLDAFVSWLRARQVPEANLGSYRAGAERLLAVAGQGKVFPKHLDEAVRREEASGGSPKRLANLHRIGQVLLQFQAEAGPPLPQPAPMTQRPPEPRPEGAAAYRKKDSLANQTLETFGAAGALASEALSMAEGEVRGPDGGFEFPFPRSEVQSVHIAFFTGRLELTTPRGRERFGVVFTSRRELVEALARRGYPVTAS